MTTVAFYHLQRSSLEEVLPSLLQRACTGGYRALVKVGQPERVQQLDALLWSYDPQSFLPHGPAGDDHESEHPVLLTTGNDNLNNGNLLVLLDDCDDDDLARFERVVDIFDGRNQNAVVRARQRWKQRRDAGLRLTYWQQNERRGWTMKMDTGSDKPV